MAEHSKPNREATLRQQYKLWLLDIIETGEQKKTFENLLKDVKGLNPADILATPA